MKYCKSCLQTDTRPGIKFDINGICPSCNYHSSLKYVDWDKRRELIYEVVDFGKRNSDSGYDSIIGVSGGKDSLRQALFVRDILKMNPLLISLNFPPQQVTQRGVLNSSNMVEHGFDCISIQPSPQTWRSLMKKGFLKYGNWGKSTEMALFSSVPRLAIAYQIPLIWWGENAALQLGDLNVMGDNGYDGNNLRSMNTLGGGDITWLLDKEISKNKILQYVYPFKKDIENANIKIVFLGYFWKNWSQFDNGNFSALRGLHLRDKSPTLTGDILGTSALDDDFVAVNQMIKYLKFGFGKVSDQVNEEIRFNRMTRDEGIFLVEKYDGKCDKKIIKDFSDYLDISVDKFWEVVDSYLNKKLFQRKSKGKYIRKFKVGIGIK